MDRLGSYSTLDEYAMDSEGAVIPLYKGFQGDYAEQMSSLVGAGRVPCSIADFLARRFFFDEEKMFRESTPKEIRMCANSWYKEGETGDMIAYHPNGNFKIVLDAELLRKISREQISFIRGRGALVLPDGMYETLAGNEFRRSDVKVKSGRSTTIEEAKADPVWQFTARDKELLNAYADRISQITKTWDGFDRAMGIILDGIPERPIARPLSLGCLRYFSKLSGLHSLYDTDGCLVGKIPTKGDKDE